MAHHGLHPQAKQEQEERGLTAACTKCNGIRGEHVMAAKESSQDTRLKLGKKKKKTVGEEGHK